MFPARRTCPTRSGITLAEVITAAMIVGVMTVVSLNALGTVTRGSMETRYRAKAVQLAQDLLSEVLQVDYLEPDDPAVFGTETGEDDGTRDAFDDADDYDNWNKKPPQAKDGTVLPDLSEWRRKVTVKHLDPNDLTSELADNDDRGVKWIKVVVKYQGETLANMSALQTKAWIDTVPEPGNDRTTGSSPPVNRPPIASATGNPLFGTGQVTVNFDASASSDPDGDPISFAWDFGDGGSGTGAQPVHTFTNGTPDPILRTVTVTVTDPWGGEDSDTLSVTIDPI